MLIIQIYGGTPQKVDGHVHLDMVIDRKLKWILHIDQLIQKAVPQINCVTTLSKVISGSVHTKCYNHVVLPVLEDGDDLYDNCTLYNEMELEKHNGNVPLFAMRHLVEKAA